MSTTVNTRLPKICFASAGDVVQLPDNATGEIKPEFYLVCRLPSTRSTKNLEAAIQSNGLYSHPAQHFLVNIDTGEAVAMPHLSSRARIMHDPTKVLAEKKDPVRVVYCDSKEEAIINMQRDHIKFLQESVPVKLELNGNAMFEDIDNENELLGMMPFSVVIHSGNKAVINAAKMRIESRFSFKVLANKDITVRPTIYLY
ncbi:hypothetical protein [Ralstonia phage RP13]|nr:hypothetical protein [Ralstonia phage RP13]